MDYDFTPPTNVPIFVLVRDMASAQKIVKTAKESGLLVRNFDRAKPLLESLNDKVKMIFIDCDGCERDSFSLLQTLKTMEDYKHLPVLGFVTASKRALKQEIETSGCLRAYFKTDFFKELPSLIVRFMS